VTVARQSLGPRGSLAAALIWLTNLGVVEKGRLIEIEALYVSLTAIAFVCWLSWWQERRSRWLTWTVPWIVLGLALLAKGPLHLFFFYAVVAAVLYRARQLRELWNSAHLCGVLLMLGIFAAWAIPCLWIMSQADVGHAWARQFTGRLSGEDFKLSGWIMNIPRGLGYFLPWTLLIPFAARRRALSDLQAGLVAGIAISFLAVSLLPGSLARYTMPLLGPAVWVGALLLTDRGIPLPRWLHRERLPMIMAAVFAVAIALYALVLMPHLQQRAKVRNIAAQLNAALPPTEPLYAVDPEYQPALFYIREPIIYIATAAELPAEAQWILAQPQRESELVARAAELGRAAEVALRVTDYRKKEVILFRLPGGG
jgi:4-amino-4-deoxy-L-arabinose transferase-like glycosyltransferase